MMETAKIRATLLGARGYSGQCLRALIVHHPRVLLSCPELEVATSAVSGGQGISSPVPPSQRMEVNEANVAKLAAQDLVILALPAEGSRPWLAALLDRGATRILDLSDALRLDPSAHYGIPELFGAPPDSKRVVANPGCYPTATLLALLPLLRAGLIASDGIGVVGASGASGAGKALREDLHFCNLVDNPFPYKIGSHRHQPEIEAHLRAPISLVTQILPVQRGMMVSAFVRPCAAPQALHAELRRTYDQHPYVHVLDEAGPRLGMRHAIGTHDCLLAVGGKESSGLVPVFSTIDNLMRGAASQALHNLNLWFGFPEHLGLPTPTSHGLRDAIPAMHGAASYPS